MDSPGFHPSPVPSNGGTKRKFFILLILLCVLFPGRGFAQSSNRWLFVFQTSASMGDRVKGVEDVTMDLLATGMHGNMRAGDTVGIWAFNDKLHEGEVPLQTWSPETAGAVAQNTFQFLHKQHYTNSANFDSVVAGMFKLVKTSGVITVILISDGSSPIFGTPFDAKLNTFYKENYRQQKKKKLPFISVFRGNGGNLTTNTLTMAPWPVDIPAVPAPQVASQKPAPPVQPLIVVGKKPVTVAPPASLPVSVPAPIVEKTTPPVVPIAPTVGANPAAVMPVMTSNLVQAAALPAAPVESKTVEPPPAPIEPPAAPPVPTPKPAAPPVTPPPVLPEPKAVVTTPPAAPPTVVSTPTPPPVKPVKLAPAVTPLPYPDVAPRVETALSNSVIPSEIPPVQPGAETATVTPSQSFFNARNIALAATALVAVAGGFIIILAARRPRPGASLITRSQDRKK